ncbi:MAG TPA: hypothetical protein GXZ50_03540 [Clostridia bacterium]|nr:hypothetical protein [Clostridia bacterium]
MAYVCPTCGKTTKLPGYCCGRAMVSQGSYVCKQCGNSQATAGTCCNQPLIKI